MANLLDKAIGYFNPRAGAARAAHRRRMEILDGARSYEGASTGRLAKGINVVSGTADAEIRKAGQTLRDRSRELVRNNPLATTIVGKHADNFVGFGITPRVKDEKVMSLFNKWKKVCFSGTGLDFDGGVYLMARMMVQDGEVYVRRRVRSRGDGFPVPLQLQILESEYCDWTKQGVPPGNPGNRIIQGVEFDAVGNRRGYWMFNDHPKSGLSYLAGGLDSVVSKFIPENEIAHLYEPQNNQVHGVPWLHSVMNEIHDLKDYELAENIRKKVESCMVGMVIPGDEDVDESDPNIGLDETVDKADAVGVTDIYGFPFERMEPGMFGVLRGGKDIKFNSPAISAGVEAYIRTRQRSIAAGVRMPYEIMTGDFSQANFASGKLGLLAYQNFVEIVQWHYIIPMVLQKIWGWFIQAAILDGSIPKTWNEEVEWVPPEVASITRLDDARADLAEVRMGKRSMQDVIAATGRDPQQVLKEIDEWNQSVDKTKSKVVLDSDPRKVTSQGQSQWVQEGDSNTGGSNAKSP